jgi:hypothetical protein
MDGMSSLDGGFTWTGAKDAVFLPILLAFRGVVAPLSVVAVGVQVRK